LNPRLGIEGCGPAEFKRLLIDQLSKSLRNRPATPHPPPGFLEAMPSAGHSALIQCSLLGRFGSIRWFRRVDCNRDAEFCNLRQLLPVAASQWTSQSIAMGPQAVPVGLFSIHHCSTFLLKLVHWD